MPEENAAAPADDDELTPFEKLAVDICELGEEYVGGATLRVTATQVRVACSECGEVHPGRLYGWSSDWMTLCQEARAHAIDKEHEVAVSLWRGAIYGPLRREGS